MHCSVICFLYLYQSYNFDMPSAVQGPQTLYDKVLEAHIVDEKPDGTVL